LLPKVLAPEIFELALVNSSGNVSDLILKVEDIEGQIIKISMDNFYNKSSNICSLSLENKWLVQSQEQEIARMIRSMVLDKEDKYYVIRVKRKINRLKNIGLSVEQDRIYRFGKLIGARLNITNKNSKKLIHLNEAYFKIIFLIFV
jgi:hypothetical protein